MKNEILLIERALSVTGYLSKEDCDFLRAVYARNGRCRSQIERLRLSRILRDFAVIQPWEPLERDDSPQPVEEVAAPTPEPITVPITRDSRPEVTPEVDGRAEEETEAPITVYGRRETDESYEGMICSDGDLRIVDCKDSIQWIAQRFTGGQWRNQSFHRTRASLITRYGPLKMILALPEHHDGFVEMVPRCKVCKRWKLLPRDGLTRHMFCIAVRKRQRLMLAEAA